MKKCVFCNEPFTPLNKNGLTKYCSEMCRSRAKTEQRHKLNPPTTLQCIDCGVDFKRRSAVGKMCIDCTKKHRDLKARAVKGEVPKYSEEENQDMISKWLKDNKAKVA